MRAQSGPTGVGPPPVITPSPAGIRGLAVRTNLRSMKMLTADALGGLMLECTAMYQTQIVALRIAETLTICVDDDASTLYVWYRWVFGPE